MKSHRVDPSQRLLKERVAWSSLESELLKEVGIEVDLCNKVTISQTRVELECEQDKESGEGELDRPTPRASDVGNGIAKADKFVEQKMITASLGRIM
ncbi:MAG: hypothetical protein KGD60_10710 [Candidatus Thorarchaeota archaeon]|nr:hypothetical protein [Candidatus Thorarchaeota archaeon]